MLKTEAISPWLSSETCGFEFFPPIPLLPLEFVNAKSRTGLLQENWGVWALPVPLEQHIKINWDPEPPEEL